MFGGPEDLDTEFPIPRSEAFAQTLSTYALFEGDMSNLVPAEDTYLYELSSELFTDYAKKQRLVKLPVGQSADVLSDRIADFPEGTIVAKTFYFPSDMRDESLGRRIIETRLMVMTGGVWNVATYIWNEDQTDAVVNLDDVTTDVTWISEAGQTRTTEYEIPGEVACVSCHQLSGDVELLGLTPRNLNRDVSRDGDTVNQLAHLQAVSVLSEIDPASIASIVDYADTSNTLATRARAYLDVNCSHCHNPDAWEEPAEEDLDLRFETPLGQTGIQGEADEIEELLTEGNMPYIGTTVLHDEGIQLVLDYLDTL